MAANHVEEGNISILEIKDKSLSKDVQVVFSPRSSFLAYGVERKNRKKIWDNQHLHEINIKGALFNIYVRKLVNESQGVFLSLNTRLQDLKGGKRTSEISKISQKYRSVLLACIEDLDSAVESTGDEELSDLRDMFADIELVWHLVQSLMIHSQSGCRVLYKLLEWIKWHYVLAEKKMEEINMYEEAANHPQYWDTIIQFLLQGKITSARSLLAMHPRFDREDFTSVDELLKKMPMYFSSSGMSLNEFHIRWKHWQDECVARLQRREFAADSNLETICKVLCGDKDVLTAKSYLCCNWYHLMISYLLYTDPCINPSDLGNVARAFYNNASCSEWNKSSIVDSLILATMELDVINIINIACSFNDGWWFAAHMMDLLSHGNYIDSAAHSNYSLQYRNYLLKNYAETLFSHSSLWEVGISYLDQCQNGGREVLELYLERIPLQTESKARKIIHIAKERNMENLVKTISNVMTSKAMKNGMLGTAVSWVTYSKDVKYADEIADKWMKDYIDKRNMECFEMLYNMASYMLVSDKMTFVGKYCEFHKLYSEGDYKNAAALLVSLVASGIAPPEENFCLQIWNFCQLLRDSEMIMLLDSLPLLESKELIFSSKDTYQLMKCLEEIVYSSRKKEGHESDDKESLIRLALIRNLARSFVLEDSED